MTWEKEAGIRLGMRMVGLRESVYWSAWFFEATVFNLAAVLTVQGVGIALGIRFFSATPFSGPFVLLFAFAMSMVPFSFFFVTMLKTSRSALVVSMGIVAVGAVFQLIVGIGGILMTLLHFNQSTVNIFRSIFNCWPPFNFAKGFFDINFVTPQFDTTKPGWDWTYADEPGKTLFVF